MQKKPCKFNSNPNLFFWLSSFFFLGLNLHAQDLSQLNNLCANLSRNVALGVIVTSVKNNQVIYEHNADQLFMPSSTLKILTAAVGLKRLGPDFTYTTELLVSPDLNNCPKNIYLKFSGDPSLTAKDLTQLFNALTQLNIGLIAGNIIYDDSGYTVPKINTAWMVSDIETCEMVPLSKAIIDHNYYHFEIHPANALSLPSILKPKLKACPEYPIDNQVITSLDKDTIWRKYGFINNILCIQGKAGINRKPQRIELPITDLDQYIQQNIANALQYNNIVLEGSILPGKIPNDTIVLAKHGSITLNAILAKGLKFSENVPFGALLLELASLDNPTATSWRNACSTLTTAIKDYYSIDLSKAVIDDGIGLSRYNLISPRQLSELLISIYKDPSISSCFMNSLAQNGHEGDLQKRLTDEPFLGKIKAKTGSMTGLSSLAGYLTTSKGDLLSFVIFVNGFSGPSQFYRDFQDQCCRILMEQL